MTKSTLITGVFENQTDKQIIKKYNLKVNSPARVNDILNDLQKVIVRSKSEIPKEFISMSQWGRSFENAWLRTKSLNDISPLQYLINYCIQTNTQGFDLMSQVAFMPKEFQIIFAKYLVRSK